jgi:ATP-binding protein involved in chromosome partitioning
MPPTIPITADLVRATLRDVPDPTSGPGAVAADLIDGIDVHDGIVQVALRTDRARAARMEPMRAAAAKALMALPGVRSATVVLTAEARPAAAQPAAPAGPAHAPHGAGRPKLLSNVGAVVAVASGKGGVGKSTVAVNLAVALARAGHRTGLLDADIYGPSLPRMLGVSKRPEVHDKMIQPIRAWGVDCMSIGFLVEEETPMIWRGPMVMGALEQMMGQVSWPSLDVMIVDMPPGTGDAQLTLAQKVSLAGAVIVSTPQDIALIDARRGVRMFEKTEVKVLGLIENMSVFVCPNCGHHAHPFGHGGARDEASRLGVEFLGEVPLRLDIRTAADAGTPIVAAEPDGEAAHVYAAIAARLWDKVSPV